MNSPERDNDADIPLREAAIAPMPPELPTELSADMVGLAQLRNDLERPALVEFPVIGDALAAIRSTSGCRLARMSGSGASCFGLYADAAGAMAAAKKMTASNPGWWVRPAVLGSGRQELGQMALETMASEAQG